MILLSTHESSRIRNLALSALHQIAAETLCEVPDILALLVTTRIPSVSGAEAAEKLGLVTTPNSPSRPIPQAPAARTSPVPVAVQAEEERHASSVNNSDAFDPPPMDGTTYHRGAGASPTKSPLPGDPADGADIPPNRAPAPSAAFSPKRVTNRQLVRDAHAAHPDWTASQIASDTGLGTQQVRVIASQCSLTLPSDARPPNSTSLHDRVLAAYEADPSATNRAIAEAVGCSYSTVSVWLAPHREASPAKPQEPVERAGPPTPRPEPKQPPVSTAAEPFDDDEPAPVIRRVMKAPTGRFYLREPGGDMRFVHQSLQPSPTGPGPLMTSDRKWAWYDTMERYRGAKKLWPELAEMRKEAAQS